MNCHIFLLNNKQKLLKIKSHKIKDIYNELDTGDIFFSHNTGCNIVNAIQNAFVHTRFTHCGIICEIDGIKYIFESYGDGVFNDIGHYGFRQPEFQIKNSGVIMSPLITRINNTDPEKHIIVICKNKNKLQTQTKEMVKKICLACRENVEYPSDFNFIIQYITSSLGLARADTFRKMSKLHCYQFVALVLDMCKIIPNLYNKSFPDVERLMYEYSLSNCDLMRIDINSNN